MSKVLVLIGYKSLQIVTNTKTKQLKTKINIMGLDTTYDCWNGPYLSFNRYRYSLGHQIGINLDDYEGYNKEGSKDLKSIKNELMPLFNHSDCDGRLTLKECKSIVKGLNDILENFNKEIEADYDFKENITKFRDGCLRAISDKKMVHFN